MMTFLILISVSFGVVCGRLTNGTVVVPPQVEFAVFAVMLFGIGVQVGQDRQLWQRIRGIGWSALYLPLQITFGTVLGALCAALVMGWPLGTTTAVGAGSGWYSLTAILLNQLSGPSAGALGFIANVLREILSFVLIPVVAPFVGGRIAVALGGATTMDTTLAVIVEHTTADVALLAFSSGVIVSILVPVLVPLVYQL